MNIVFSPGWETRAFILPFNQPSWSYSYFPINHTSGCLPPQAPLHAL